MTLSDLPKLWPRTFQNSDFQSHFSLLVKMLEFGIFKIHYFLKMCQIFVGSVHNFGSSDSEKMLISTRWLNGFMSNLIKKAWKDSNSHGVVTCSEWEKNAATHAHPSSQHDGSESYFKKNAPISLSKSISRMPWES